MEIGIIGEARGLAARAVAAGLKVFVLEEAAATEGVIPVAGLVGFRAAMVDPRPFLIDMAPGAEIDAVIDAAYLHMDPGDFVIDASGSYWGDTLRRWRRMRHRSIYYLDAVLNTDRTLLAGDQRGRLLARPVLERLAAAVPLLEVGEAGAAHYALMVEDALAAMAARVQDEARLLFEAFPGDLDVAALLGPMVDTLPIDAPRAGWLLQDAVHLHAPVPCLAQAVMQTLADALDDQRTLSHIPRLGPFVHPDELG